MGTLFLHPLMQSSLSLPSDTSISAFVSRPRRQGRNSVR